MNMNQLFNMFTRLVARRAMNWGINKGLNTMSRRGKSGPGGQPKGQGKQTRDLARKMRTLTRLIRR